MEVARRRLGALLRWEYAGLCLIVLFTLAIHLVIIARPAEPIFDEQHYVNDARSILRGDLGLRAEHPVLGRLLLTASMYVFGDNPLGWRFFSVLFGTIGIVLFYFICKELKMPQKAVLMATFLFGLENMSFVQASVAMLDIYMLFFMLVGFWLYLKRGYLLGGASLGLSTLAKLSGALTLPIVGIHWLLARRDHWWRFALSMLVAPLVFIVLTTLLNYFTSGKFVDPFKSIKTMLDLSGSLTFATVTHPYATRPWHWVMYPLVMPYWYTPHYISSISFTLWGLIVPGMGYALYRAIKGSEAALFAVAWFAGTYLVWIPLSLITDRISYLYYFYPAVGAVCIAVGLGLSHLIDIWQRRREGVIARLSLSVVMGILILHLGVFIMMSPASVWWSVPVIGAR